MKILFGQTTDIQGRPIKTTVDGYCPECKLPTPFAIEGIYLPNTNAWLDVQKRSAYDDLTVTCTRKSHTQQFFFRIHKMTITKVGQYPSLADVAIDETREKYKRVLKGDNWSELYRAIGLAAHGEGIGAFVYLRRVFERLIISRFNEYKGAEGWTDAEFFGVRMDEKIDFLKGHLPAFLVDNRRLYAIYSVGVHELENAKCLEFFPIGKGAILMILEEDLAKKDQLERQQELKQQIAKFQAPPATMSDK